MPWGIDVALVKIVMQVEVTFDAQGVPTLDLGCNMIRVIEHGMAECLFTGASAATVEDWTAKIISEG